jgi:hypothetical protein
MCHQALLKEVGYFVLVFREQVADGIDGSLCCCSFLRELVHDDEGGEKAYTHVGGDDKPEVDVVFGL